MSDVVLVIVSGGWKAELDEHAIALLASIVQPDATGALPAPPPFTIAFAVNAALDAIVLDAL